MSGCGCIYVGDTYEAQVRFQDKNPVARKTHTCHECDRAILPGERYLIESGIWEGEHYTYKTCSDCLSIREVFFCDGWIYGQVLSCVDEHINALHGEIASSCLTELTPAARAWVLDRIDVAFDELNKDEQEFEAA